MKRCARCLFYEGMTFYLARRELRGVCAPGALRLDSEGICSVCRRYEAEYAAADVQTDMMAFTLSTLGKKGPGALVALSGGKDSIAALFLARVELGLRVVAMLYDNGFVPEAVVLQARDVCRKLGVELVVVAPRVDEAAHFAKLVGGAGLGDEPPCQWCGEHINSALDETAAQLGVEALIFGTNFFAAWTHRPWAIARRESAGGRRMLQINLPYALGVTRERTEAILGELDVQTIELPGVSTNCRVPSLVQRRVSPGLGHIPELEVLSLEVIVGHLERDVALTQLAAKAGS